MKIFLILVFFISISLVSFPVSFPRCASAEVGDSASSSDQQILEFELSGFGDKGRKTWDVEGKSADIFSDSVGLNDIEARVYGEDDNAKLTAERGTYDKTKGNIHLEDNVVVTTDSGAKLLTDSLDWHQEGQQVSTKDDVDITKDKIKIIGKGIEAEPNLKKVKLHEDVKVDIQDNSFSLTGDDLDEPEPEEDRQPVTITCDGPLNVNYDKQIADFNNNVKVVHAQGEMYADKMLVFFDAKGDTIERVESYGNVKIVNGQNSSYSQEAIYTAQDKKIVLTGKPHLVIYSGSSMNFME